MSTSYCSTQDKRGRTLYWRVLKNGNRKRVSAKIALKGGNIRPCSGIRSSKKSPKRSLNPGFLLSLPPEIFEEFILRMDAKDVVRLCSTSKALREHCGDRVWQILVHRDFPGKSPEEGQTWKELYQDLSQPKILNDLVKKKPKGWRERIKNLFSEGKLVQKFGGRTYDVSKLYWFMQQMTISDNRKIIALYYIDDGSKKQFATVSEFIDYPYNHEVHKWVVYYDRGGDVEASSTKIDEYISKKYHKPDLKNLVEIFL